MALSKTAVELGVVGAIGEFLIFNHFMPPVCDVRAQQPYDRGLESSERTGLLIGAAFLALLTTFSPGRLETFSIVGGSLVAIDYVYKHANAVHPATGSMQGGMGDEQSLYALPDYAADGTG